jgi:hypothetical protein
LVARKRKDAVKISPRETRVADPSGRIHELVRSHLSKLGCDASGWETLYVDPVDGRLWELTYPQSGLHGGGPPELRCLTRDEARRKYGDAVPAE